MQLTKSSISFHVSPEIAFNPFFLAPSGRFSGEGANQTSSNFSGPACVSDGSLKSEYVLTFECIAAIKVDSSFTIDRKMWCTFRRRESILRRNFEVDHNYYVRVSVPVTDLISFSSRELVDMLQQAGLLASTVKHYLPLRRTLRCPPEKRRPTGPWEIVCAGGAS